MVEFLLSVLLVWVLVHLHLLLLLPAKRWEQVVEKLIFGVVAAGLVALAGIVIAKLF